MDKGNFPAGCGPVLGASNVHYELSGRAVGTPYGGIGLVQRLAGKIGLAEAIDARLHVLKIHLPYHESDHVLSLA